MNIEELAARVRQLESIEEIQRLKAHYLASCDAKKPADVRSCFADGRVHIDYGVVGVFDSADALVEVYEKAACHPHMVEMHHGVNPQITILDCDNASGRWGLQYQLINTQDNTLTQLGGFYEDEYKRTSDGWKISSTRFEVTSTLVVSLGESMATVLAARTAG